MAKPKMKFEKAMRQKSRLRLCLCGPSGSGKTMGALLIAKGLGGRVAFVDTERGSASLYSDKLDFDVLELAPPYHPDNYIEAIKTAEAAGYDVLIIDSITHEWKGEGGVLELVTAAATKYRGNTYTAWNDVDPIHRRFIDTILNSNLHVICTMRSKTAYVETEKNGKKTYEKQGTAPEQRDGIEYEFTLVLDLAIDGHYANPSKDRTELYSHPFKIDEKTGQELLDWLNSGKSLSDITKERNAALLSQYLARISEAPTVEDLTSYYHAHKSDLIEHPDWAGTIQPAMATRRKELEAPEQNPTTAANEEESHGAA